MFRPRQPPVPAHRLNTFDPANVPDTSNIKDDEVEQEDASTGGILGHIRSNCRTAAFSLLQYPRFAFVMLIFGTIAYVWVFRPRAVVVPFMLQLLNHTEHAVRVLHMLAQDSSGRSSLVCYKAVLPLLRLLSDGGPTIVSLVERTMEGLDTEAKHTVPQFIEVLNSPMSTPGAKVESVRILQRLAQVPANHAYFAHAGGMLALVQLLADTNPNARELAAESLAHLTICAVKRKEVLSGNAVSHLVKMLSNDSENARKHALAVFENFSADSDEDWIRKIIAAEGVPCLLRLLSIDSLVEAALVVLSRIVETGDGRKAVSETGGSVTDLIRHLSLGKTPVKTGASKSLKHLAKDEQIRKSIVDAGVIEPLLAVLKSDGSEAEEHAAGVLQNLTLDNDTKEILAKKEIFVLLVKLLRKGNNGTKEAAALALGYFASSKSYQSHRFKIANAGTIPALVQILKEEGSGGAEAAILAAISALTALVHQNPDNVGVAVNAHAFIHLQQLRTGGSEKVKSEAVRLENILSR